MGEGEWRWVAVEEMRRRRGGDEEETIQRGWSIRG